MTAAKAHKAAKAHEAVTAYETVKGSATAEALNTVKVDDALEAVKVHRSGESASCSKSHADEAVKGTCSNQSESSSHSA